MTDYRMYRCYATIVMHGPAMVGPLHRTRKDEGAHAVCGLLVRRHCSGVIHIYRASATRATAFMHSPILPKCRRCWR